MDDETKRRRHQEARQRRNEAFVKRLYERRPRARARHQEMLRRLMPEAVREPRRVLEALDEAPDRMELSALVLETIVRAERPVLFVQDDWLNHTEVTIIGDEAQELVDDLEGQRQTFAPLMPLVGRIDVTNFPGSDFVGTGWFVAPDVVVTNRHVASLVARWDGRKYAFTRGVGGRPIGLSLGTGHEFDDLAPDQARSFAVTEVLYIEPESGRHDIAFLKVKRRTDGAKPAYIPIATANIGVDERVCVVGYPARAPRSVIPDQDLMKDLYRDRYDVKRAAPGLTMPSSDGTLQHDCTTLGGNSGSVVLDLKTGMAVGLHFAGLYHEANYAVQARDLHDYVSRKRWTVQRIETTPRLPAAAAQSQATSVAAQVPVVSTAPQSGAATITLPLSITLSVGVPVLSGGTLAPPVAVGVVSAGRPAVPLEAAESACRDFWDQRPEGVIAVRVGFEDDGDTIGEAPFIAASATADRLASLRSSGISQFQSLPVRYLPADVAEQLEALPLVESVDSIAYDDDQRRGPGFSFSTVDQEMSVLAHVGPEYSWDVLKEFLGDARRSLVSAIYEFHGSHIADALEERLNAAVSLQLVMDNASFVEVKDEDQEFDRVERFAAWQESALDFSRIVVPEGRAGLISDAYHIKVTVRDDDAFWLSSGNWKMGSSQPPVSQEERDNALDVDLPGNREWHVVVRNAALAERFRNHIQQDFRRSEELGGGVVPRSHEATELLVDVPLEEAPLLERRPPEAVVEPQEFRGRIKVKPLLTPDREGAVYSDAVLKLIRSARKSLWFQIPYIAMPSNPRADRGFIDELIKALAQKLKTLPDARLLLRTGSSRYSHPAHAAWYFKSKGVDVANRVRQIADHHTKGMIVDGKRLLLGSHNWSQPGVSLNRDASLLFDHADLAAYYARAFEIDWNRATKITPKKFTAEAPILEAAGSAPAPGYRRVRLSELLKEDD